MQQSRAKERLSTPPPSKAAEAIMHYRLKGLVPKDHAFALNTFLGTLSLIASAPEGARLIAEQQFTVSSLTVLIPVLEAFPNFCPNEVLLASFLVQVTKDEVERCRKLLQAAKLKGGWDKEIRPIRNVVSRTRIKMRNFGVKTYYILEVGYGLMPAASHSEQDENVSRTTT